MAEKTEDIRIRVSPEQKELLRSAAKGLGLTLSGYMTFCAFERLGEQLGQAIIDRKDRK